MTTAAGTYPPRSTPIRRPRRANSMYGRCLRSRRMGQGGRRVLCRPYRREHWRHFEGHSILNRLSMSSAASRTSRSSQRCVRSCWRRAGHEYGQALTTGAGEWNGLMIEGLVKRRCVDEKTWLKMAATRSSCSSRARGGGDARHFMARGRLLSRASPRSCRNDRAAWPLRGDRRT